MPRPPTPPLNDSHYQQINDQLRQLNELQQQIDTAKAAGISCDERDPYCKHLRQQLEQLKRAYFPDRP